MTKSISIHFGLVTNRHYIEGLQQEKGPGHCQAEAIRGLGRPRQQAQYEQEPQRGDAQLCL